MRRVQEKQRLAWELIEGRLSLPEAAARYRDLEEQQPSFNWRGFRCTCPGESDDERHCREVIVFVGVELQGRPETDLALVGRLEAELQARLGRGDFHLPGPSPSSP
jgi:hypothetical protein